MTGNIEIRVDPTELIGKSESVSESIRKMQDRLGELGNIIRRTEGYWIGEAGEQHRKMYFDQEAVQTEIMNRLSRHPKNLLMMAGIMKDADTRLSGVSRGLPTNIYKS